MVKPDGSNQDVITELPSFGDHHNNRVIFGPDGKMYIGQGMVTNSGVVVTKI
jgi:glucose/arabinose dehydrogenase